MKLVTSIFATVLVLSTTAIAAPNFDRNTWSNWQGRWAGDFWTAGNFGTSQYMTCVGVDGSWGSPEYWAAGLGDDAARDAYMQTLSWSNVAGRNPVYIEVHCGY